MRPLWTCLLILPLALPPACSGEALDFLLTRNQRAQKLVEEGQRQILRGNYLQAIDSCTRALGIRDDWGPAYLCRSEARLLTKDAQAASQDAQKAYTLDPKSGGPFRILGILEFQSGRYAQAAELFTRALKLTKMRPEDISDVFYYRAYSYFNIDRFADALSDVDNGLGVLRGVNGDYSDSSFYALRAEINRRIGKDAVADADERRVLRLVDERIRQNPADLVELLRRRAEAHAHLREYAESAKDYDQLLAQSPDDARALVDQANVYSLAGRHADAVKQLDRALTVDPASLPALRLRAMERFTLGDLQGSLADLDAALALKPDDAATLTHRGILKRYLADYKGSLKDLDSAQALNPAADSSFWGHKAYVLEMLDDHAGAIVAAEKALRVDPDNKAGHTAMALATTALGRCDAAMPSLNWLTQHGADSEQFYRLRGECRCKADELPGCVSDMQSALTLDPASPLIALRVAQSFRKYLDVFPLKAIESELRKARDYYSRAAGLKPLPAADRLEQARTSLELSRVLPNRGARGERARLAREAQAACQAVLKEDPRNRKALDLLRQSRQPLKTGAL